MYSLWSNHQTKLFLNRQHVALTLATLLLLCAACKKDKKSSPETNNVHIPTEYTLNYPDYFPLMYVPENNPLTVEGVALGRRLYYDNKLSLNGPLEGLSCSSCHFQNSSFTINAPGIAVLPHVNLGWSRTFLWEGKVEGQLEDIMRFEVEEFFNADMNVLQSDAEYPLLYKKAFGNSTITKEKTAHALAQFFRTLISMDSKYDVYLKHGDFEKAGFTAEERRGYFIFFREKGDCFHCHSNPLLTDNAFHNIGLDSVFEESNRGRYNVTTNGADMGLFKTPTLRNIELTAPYMHDGRFTTLREVVDHYNSGVLHSNTLDPIMTKAGKEFGLLLSEQDKIDLIAFLKTFTDNSFTTNPDHNNPF